MTIDDIKQRNHNPIKQGYYVYVIFMAVLILVLLLLLENAGFIG